MKSKGAAFYFHLLSTACFLSVSTNEELSSDLRSNYSHESYGRRREPSVERSSEDEDENTQIQIKRRVPGNFDGLRTSAKMPRKKDVPEIGMATRDVIKEHRSKRKYRNVETKGRSKKLKTVKPHPNSGTKSGSHKKNSSRIKQTPRKSIKRDFSFVNKPTNTFSTIVHNHHPLSDSSLEKRNKPNESRFQFSERNIAIPDHNSFTNIIVQSSNVLHPKNQSISPNRIKEHSEELVPSIHKYISNAVPIDYVHVDNQRSTNSLDGLKSVEESRVGQNAEQKKVTKLDVPLESNLIVEQIRSESKIENLVNENGFNTRANNKSRVRFIPTTNIPNSFHGKKNGSGIIHSPKNDYSVVSISKNDRLNRNPTQRYLHTRTYNGSSLYPLKLMNDPYEYYSAKNHALLKSRFKFNNGWRNRINPDQNFGGVYDKYIEPSQKLFRVPNSKIYIFTKSPSFIYDLPISYHKPPRTFSQINHPVILYPDGNFDQIRSGKLSRSLVRSMNFIASPSFPPKFSNNLAALSGDHKFGIIDNYFANKNLLNYRNAQNKAFLVNPARMGYLRNQYISAPANNIHKTWYNMSDYLKFKRQAIAKMTQTPPFLQNPNSFNSPTLEVPNAFQGNGNFPINFALATTNSKTNVLPNNGENSVLGGPFINMNSPYNNPYVPNKETNAVNPLMPNTPDTHALNSQFIGPNGSVPVGNDGTLKQFPVTSGTIFNANFNSQTVIPPIVQPARDKMENETVLQNKSNASFTSDSNRSFPPLFKSTSTNELVLTVSASSQKVSGEEKLTANQTVLSATPNNSSRNGNGTNAYSSNNVTAELLDSLKSSEETEWGKEISKIQQVLTFETNPPSPLISNQKGKLDTMFFKIISLLTVILLCQLAILFIMYVIHRHFKIGKGDTGGTASKSKHPASDAEKNEYKTTSKTNEWGVPLEELITQHS